MDIEDVKPVAFVVAVIAMIALIAWVSIENHKAAEERWARNNALFQDCLRRQQNKDIDLFCSQYDPERIELERRKVNAMESQAWHTQRIANELY